MVHHTIFHGSYPIQSPYESWFIPIFHGSSLYFMLKSAWHSVASANLCAQKRSPQRPALASSSMRFVFSAWCSAGARSWDKNTLGWTVNTYGRHIGRKSWGKKRGFSWISGWWLGEPLWKIWVKVNWDDDRFPIVLGKCQKWQPVTTNQRKKRGFSCI